MDEQLKKYLDKGKSLRKENKKFYAGLGRRKDLDRLFHDHHDTIFEEVDCLKCANCCKTTSPIFRDIDIDRIASHLGIRPSELTEKYLHIDEDGDWVLNSSPCHFLDHDNYCKIYEVRPKACREYPHTDRKNMTQILDLTYRNTLVCPAVAEITERIKREIGG